IFLSFSSSAPSRCAQQSGVPALLHRSFTHPAVNTFHKSSARDGWKIPLFQNKPVMNLVTRSDERQRANAHFLLAGNSLARPSFFRKRTKQCEARATY